MNDRPLTFATMPKDVREAVLIEMEELHARYDAGDQMALMTAIARSAMYDMALPNWTADAYMSGYHAVTQRRAGSWDDVFGDPVPKGRRLSRLRQHRSLQPKVMGAIKAILDINPSTPIDDQLFERVGDQLGVGKTLVKKIWYGLSLPLRHYAVRAKQGMKLPR